MGGGGGWNRGFLAFEPGVGFPRRSLSFALGSLFFLSPYLSPLHVGGWVEEEEEHGSSAEIPPAQASSVRTVGAVQ